MKKKSNLIIYYLLIILIYTSYQSSEECASLDSDKCDQYTPNGSEGTKQCLPVGNEGKCDLKSCEELLSSECYLYTPIGEGAQELIVRIVLQKMNIQRENHNAN